MCKFRWGGRAGLGGRKGNEEAGTDVPRAVFRDGVDGVREMRAIDRGQGISNSHFQRKAARAVVDEFIPLTGVEKGRNIMATCASYDD